MVEDCDGNGIPDGCDIDAGEEDTDGDGILDACQLDGLAGSFNIVDDWGSGFTGELVITNYGADSIPAEWTIEFTSTFDIDNIWPAEFQIGANGRITVFAPEWSQPVMTGESIVIGMQGGYSSDVIEVPTDITLNGTEVELD